MSKNGANPGQRGVEYVPLDQLGFDPDNPRLPPNVDGTEDAAVLRWMLEDEAIVELMGSIGVQGYFSGEPLLVAPPLGHPGPPNMVVEGNRRLAAAILLRDPDRAPVRVATVKAVAADAVVRPDTLPVIRFDDREEILAYLGYRHVTGVKEWGPLAKARYLRQLQTRATAKGSGLTHQELARMIGSRSDYVRHLLEGLEVYDHVASRGFYGIEGVNEDAIQFSVLTTALSYENISEFAGVDNTDGTKNLKDGNLRELVEWMFRRNDAGVTVLGESRSLGDLAAVVKSEEARSALKQGVSLADATLLTDEPLRSFRRAIRQANDKLKVARNLTHRITEPAEEDFATLGQVVSLARELQRLMRSLLDDRDDD